MVAYDCLDFALIYCAARRFQPLIFRVRQFKLYHQPKGADNLDWQYYGSVGAEWSTGLAAI